MVEVNSFRPAPVTGLQYEPARGKLWTMLIGFALLSVMAAGAAFCWWTQIALPGDRVLSAKAGWGSLAAIPLGILLVLVMALLIANAKRLVIGDDCLQLSSGGNVVVHIPFQNIEATYTDGEGNAGVVGVKLRDRADPATLVPFWVKDKYEIQVLTYGRQLAEVHGALSQRLARHRQASTA